MINRFIPNGKTVAAIRAVPNGVFGVLFTNWCITELASKPMVPFAVTILFSVVGNILYKNRELCRIEKNHHLTVTVPRVFHLFFICGGVAAGFLRTQPILLGWAILWFVGSIMFHLFATAQVTSK